MCRKEIKCHKCGHPWKTKSKALYVSCPNCLNKVRNDGEIYDPKTRDLQESKKKDSDTKWKGS